MLSSDRKDLLHNDIFRDIYYAISQVLRLKTHQSELEEQEVFEDINNLIIKLERLY